MTDFSKHMRGVNVALYGGQRYDVQLRPCVRGRRSLSVHRPSAGPPETWHPGPSKLSGLVLMKPTKCCMGFIEDVETIMAQIPEGHQTALFSATMPEAIRRITRRFYERACRKCASSVQRNYPS